MANDELRRIMDGYRLDQAGEHENDLIDNLAAGDITRGDFIRRASTLGIGAGMMGTILGSLGSAAPAFGSTPHLAQKKGGRLKVGVQPNTGVPMEPHLFADHYTLITGSITGEWLLRAQQDMSLAPELATKWSHDPALKVWTFQLRQGVKFANGQTMTSADVVATYNRLTSGNSAALSAFGGVLSSGNIKAKGLYTVEFHLDVPTASFPFLVCQTTYQAMILPANYVEGDFKAGRGVTTGAFSLTNYKEGVSATYQKNPKWWGLSAGRKIYLDGVDVKYYADEAPMIGALVTGGVHIVSQVNFASARNLFTSPALQVFRTKSAGHRDIAMLTRTTQAHKAFKNADVRKAFALAIDRPALLKSLYNGYGDIGNDSPFVPGFAATDGSVPQRKLNLTLAKQLLAKAGYPKGFSVKLSTYNYADLPALAQKVQAQVKKIGINISLDIGTGDSYYGPTYTGGPTGHGTTPWLNAPLSLTDWNHRPVPNVFITSAFMSPKFVKPNGDGTQGKWNEADYANPKFDTAAASFLKSASISDQRKYEKQMATILLADTPVVIPFFFNWVLLGAKSLKGFKADPSTHLYLAGTSLS